MNTQNHYEPPVHASSGSERQKTIHVFVLLFSAYGVFCVTLYGITVALYFWVFGDNSVGFGYYGILPALAIAGLSFAWLRRRKSSTFIVAFLTAPMVVWFTQALVRDILRGVWP